MRTNFDLWIWAVQIQFDWTSMSPCLLLCYSPFLWLYPSGPDHTGRAVLLPQSHQCSREAEMAGGVGNSQGLPYRQPNKERKGYLECCKHCLTNYTLLSCKCIVNAFYCFRASGELGGFENQDVRTQIVLWPPSPTSKQDKGQWWARRLRGGTMTVWLSRWNKRSCCVCVCMCGFGPISK